MEVSTRVPGVVYLRYEDFCVDKVDCIKRVAAQIALEIDDQYVRDNCERQASHRAYRPSGPGAFRSGLLSPADVAKVEEACGQWMARWGYSVGLDQSPALGQGGCTSVFAGATNVANLLPRKP